MGLKVQSKILKAMAEFWPAGAEHMPGRQAGMHACDLRVRRRRQADAGAWCGAEVAGGGGSSVWSASAIACAPHALA